VFKKDPATIFYSDVPEMEAKKWIAHTRPHPQSCSFYRPKCLGYDGIDVAYLYAEKDCVIPLFAQEQLVEVAKLNGVSVGEWRLPSGHFPSLSMPDVLADKIVEIISA
jgi:hypothetical protein